MKACVVCGSEFCPAGRHMTCSPGCSKVLVRKRQRAWRQANPEKVAEQDARSRLKHREARGRKSKVYNAARYASLQRFLRAVKETCGCVDCGYSANVHALQFDHVGPKATKVGQAVTIRRAVEELTHCEVRCANCHAIKTMERYLCAS